MFAPKWLVRTSAKALGKRPIIGPWSRNYSAQPDEVQEDLPEFIMTQMDWSKMMMERAQYKVLTASMAQYGSSQTRETAYHLRDGLHKPAEQATISALLASGAHFGHASTRMESNFMPYAYGVRAGITIIDLEHTVALLRRAANLVRAVARSRGSVLFVGTRPDLRPIVEKAAARMPPHGYHIGERWLPGILTNRIHMFGQDLLQKQELLPDLVVILNPLNNMSAIRECAVNHIPTIGIIDSNADPRIVMYPIPANDESTRTAEIVAGVLSIAGREGIALAIEDEKRQRPRTDEEDEEEYTNPRSSHP